MPSFAFCLMTLNFSSSALRFLPLFFGISTVMQERERRATSRDEGFFVDWFLEDKVSDIADTGFEGEEKEAGVFEDTLKCCELGVRVRAASCRVTEFLLSCLFAWEPSSSDAMRCVLHRCITAMNATMKRTRTGKRKTTSIREGIRPNGDGYL